MEKKLSGYIRKVKFGLLAIMLVSLAAAIIIRIVVGMKDPDLAFNIYGGFLFGAIIFFAVYLYAVLGVGMLVYEYKGQRILVYKDWTWVRIVVDGDEISKSESKTGFSWSQQASMELDSGDIADLSVSGYWRNSWVSVDGVKLDPVKKY